jgi:hypothetical protein
MEGSPTAVKLDMTFPVWTSSLTIKDVKSRHRGGGCLDMKGTLFLAARLLPLSQATSIHCDECPSLVLHLNALTCQHVSRDDP